MLYGIFSQINQVHLADAAALLLRPVSYRVRHRNGPRHVDAAWLLQQLNSKQNLQISYVMALDFNQTGHGSIHA